MEERPFDLLNKSLGQHVLVRLKNNMSVRGKIVAFDAHMNLVMEGSEELSNDGELRTKLGTILLRGGNILFVSPV